MLKRTLFRGVGLSACMLVALGLLTSQARAQDQLETVKKRGKLIVGIKNDYIPFGWLDKDGQLRGFEIDLAKAVAKQIVGSETAIELVPVVASNRIELLNAGRIDVIFATLGVTEARGKVIDFTDHYYMMAGLVLLTPNSATITQWEQLKGKKVCGIQGNLYNRTLSEKFGGDMLLYTGTAEMFKAFQDNRCEAIAFDGPILQQKLSEEGWTGKYKIAIGAYEFIPIAGGVRKNEPKFLAEVNKAINKAEADRILVNAEKAYKMGESEHVAKRALAAKK